MKLFIKVKTKAKKEKVEKVDEINFKVSVKEPPVKGKANIAVIKALAEYFNISRDMLKIVSGTGSRLKIIEIENV
jgi:uncharacterized protein